MALEINRKICAQAEILFDDSFNYRYKRTGSPECTCKFISQTNNQTGGARWEKPLQKIQGLIAKRGKIYNGSAQKETSFSIILASFFFSLRLFSYHKHRVSISLLCVEMEGIYEILPQNAACGYRCDVTLRARALWKFYLQKKAFSFILVLPL